MTSRLLLTLLALLTGLAAQAAPSQARAEGSRAAEVSSFAIFAGEARSSIPQGVEVLPARAAEVVQVSKPVAELASAASAAPSVLTGIDRARE